MLEITPTRKLGDLVLGEEIAYSLDCTKELQTNTISNVAYTILNSEDEDVTTEFSGGSSDSDGIIYFGIKAVTLGAYRLKFIVTCNEKLPDISTPYEFILKLKVNVKDF